MAYAYRTRRRMEFADTDMAGIVHFSRFFVLMESVEHEFLRAQGLSVHMERDGGHLSWPRLRTSCEYLQPARFEEVLEVSLKVLKVGARSLTYAFSFARGEVEVARGQLKVACCTCNPGERMRAVPIPDFFAEKIEEAPSSRE